MGEKRKGFIVFFDIAESLEAFNDEETGRIFRAMIAYAKNGEELPLPDREAIAFGFIKPQLERDGERYADICAKRKAAIEARWNNEKNTNDTNEYKRYQNKYKNKNRYKYRYKNKYKYKYKYKYRECITPQTPQGGRTAKAVHRAHG